MKFDTFALYIVPLLKIFATFYSFLLFYKLLLLPFYNTLLEGNFKADQILDEIKFFAAKVLQTTMYTYFNNMKVNYN